MSAGTTQSSAGNCSGIHVRGSPRTHREVHGNAAGGGNGWVEFHGRPSNSPDHWYSVRLTTVTEHRFSLTRTQQLQLHGNDVHVPLVQLLHVSQHVLQHLNPPKQNRSVGWADAHDGDGR
jgi:hypothetical protein